MGELKKRKFMHVKTGPFVFLGIEVAENVLRRSFHEWTAETFAMGSRLCALTITREKSFHTISRMLAYKWIKILTRASHNRELYNEECYL
jgi:hypothetical protein